MDSVDTNNKHHWLTPNRLIWGISLIGVAVFQALTGPRPLDDSYITFRYARNIIAGLGFVYNPGELVQGTTTPLYTLLLAFFSILFGADSLPIISFAIALIADILNTWFLFRIARYFLKHEVAALILAVVFLLQPLRLNVATGGMETSLFILLLLIMYDCYFLRQKMYLAAVFGSLAILTRPDAVLAVGLVFLHALWKDRNAAFKAALLGAAILAPWYIWATWYFGSPIPFSIIAKSSAYQGYTVAATLTLLLTFLGTGTIGPYQELIIIFPGLILAIFLVIFGIRWAIKENRESFIVIAYPFLYYFVMTVKRAPVFFSWYYLPLMPGFLLLFFGAFLHLFSNNHQARKRYQQEVIVGILGLILIIFPALLMQFFPGWSDARLAETLYHQASTAVQAQTSNKLVYAPDIGVIGWNLDKARILDPVGLVSPISVHYMDRFQGTDSVTIAMVKDLKPDFVIAREGFIADIIKNPDFQAHYQLIWQKSDPNHRDQKVVVYERK